MQLLSRHQLLTLEEPELCGLAACHGLDDLDALSGPQVLEALDAWLEDFRAKRGLPPLTAKRRAAQREAMATAPRRGQR
jgi:hypothetical protein